MPTRYRDNSHWKLLYSLRTASWMLPQVFDELRC